ncbi:MAG: hypothetical protein ABI318_21045, partial [Chthoniobacteraceae bacterium]
RVMEFNGTLNFTLPGGSRQQLLWAGVFEMNRSLAPERLHLDLSAREPGQHMDVLVDFAGRKAVFGAKIGDEVVNETAFTLDEAGFAALMTRAGVDPMMMKQLKASQDEIPKFDLAAQSSSLVLGGQKLETFLLTLKAGGQSLFEVQLSQLGQVLSAKAPAFGWRLTPYNLTR